ncbi:putative glycolipid-binding domain-containing protein [Streptomyces sp. NBC_01310]|uniref:putative glycolipid-binding domain-containing protein n=1 Tax=Streptomyces sp. NBC_01310 TaxID=2903820 RepID=UPI0035B60242|nr:putative glycolipid-binding domain-containing protein [Streptomyces sp. NBC_01310]
MGSTRSRVRTWEIFPGMGYTTAWVDLAPRGLSARGRAVGLVPEPYWVTYALETSGEYVTSRLSVTVETGTSTHELDLRNDAGRWTVDGAYRPDLDGALDCDLGLCPLTNTMPVLRHGLHQGPGTEPHHFLMAWVSVPDLAVSANRQTYTHLARAEHGARIRYESGDFLADVEFDDDGLVLEYPSLAAALTH